MLVYVERQFVANYPQARGYKSKVVIKVAEHLVALEFRQDQIVHVLCLVNQSEVVSMVHSINLHQVYSLIHNDFLSVQIDRLVGLDGVALFAGHLPGLFHCWEL